MIFHDFADLKSYETVTKYRRGILASFAENICNDLYGKLRNIRSYNQQRRHELSFHYLPVTGCKFETGVCVGVFLGICTVICEGGASRVF